MMVTHSPIPTGTPASTPLPLLSSYTLNGDQASGYTITGQISGMPVLLDASTITTSLLSTDAPETTLAGYAVTADNQQIYELTGPLLLPPPPNLLDTLLAKVHVDNDGLVKAATVVTIAAAGVNLLSHHLTVHMFWV